MSSTSTTFTSSDLASLNYSIILNYFKSNSNIALNLRKSLFCKFYYPQIILILETAMSAEPLGYISLDSVISSALRNRGF